MSGQTPIQGGASGNNPPSPFIGFSTPSLFSSTGASAKQENNPLFGGEQKSMFGSEAPDNGKKSVDALFGAGIAASMQSSSNQTTPASTSGMFSGGLFGMSSSSAPGFDFGKSSSSNQFGGPTTPIIGGGSNNPAPAFGVSAQPSQKTQAQPSGMANLFGGGSSGSFPTSTANKTASSSLSFGNAGMFGSTNTATQSTTSAETKPTDLFGKGAFGGASGSGGNPSGNTSLFGVTGASSAFGASNKPSLAGSTDTASLFGVKNPTPANDALNPSKDLFNKPVENKPASDMFQAKPPASPFQSSGATGFGTMTPTTVKPEESKGNTVLFGNKNSDKPVDSKANTPLIDTNKSISANLSGIAPSSLNFGASGGFPSPSFPSSMNATDKQKSLFTTPAASNSGAPVTTASATVPSTSAASTFAGFTGASGNTNLFSASKPAETKPASTTSTQNMFSAPGGGGISFGGPKSSLGESNAFGKPSAGSDLFNAEASSQPPKTQDKPSLGLAFGATTRPAEHTSSAPVATSSSTTPKISIDTKTSDAGNLFGAKTAAASSQPIRTSAAGGTQAMSGFPAVSPAATTSALQGASQPAASQQVNRDEIKKMATDRKALNELYGSWRNCLFNLSEDFQKTSNILMERESELYDLFEQTLALDAMKQHMQVSMSESVNNLNELSRQNMASFSALEMLEKQIDSQISRQDIVHVEEMKDRFGDEAEEYCNNLNTREQIYYKTQVFYDELSHIEKVIDDTIESIGIEPKHVTEMKSEAKKEDKKGEEYELIMSEFFDCLVEVNKSITHMRNKVEGLDSQISNLNIQQ